MSIDLSLTDESKFSKWPSRVAELCDSWKRATTERDRNRLLSELWLLINTALAQYVRTHGNSYGYIDPEDARDIATEKAMVFLNALGRESPGAETSNPARLCAYLSALARNGLVDSLRRQGRKRAAEQRILQEMSHSPESSDSSAESMVMHTQFIEAIRACVGQMVPRARAAWFLRTFLELPSKRIAAHPDVQMTPTAVDMLLMRVRRALRACMVEKGLSAEDAPPGTFIALWSMLGYAGRNPPKEQEDS